MLFLALFSLISSTSLALDNYWYVNSAERFDLSGLIAVTPQLRSQFGLKGDILLLNDKQPIIYEGTFKDHEIKLSPWIDLSHLDHRKHFDFEGIDTFDGKIYVANEYPPIIYVVEAHKPKPKLSRLDFSELIPMKGQPFAISSSFGIEALGVSKEGLFLGKEMMPLAVFQFGLKNSTKKKAIMHERSSMGSQSALRVKGDVFYFINREGREILKTKIPFKSEESFSFRSTLEDPRFDYIVRDGDGKIHPEWSTAEALDVLEKHIWVGLDNNGEVLRSGTERRGVVLSFRRPNNF